METAPAESDLADRIITQLETATGFVRDKVVLPARRIAALLGLASAFLVLGVAAIVFLLIGGFRLLELIPGPDWLGYLIAGAPLVLLGVVAWSRRRGASSSPHANV